MLFIAEMSCNHRGSKERALEICHAAKESGADAVKLQTYTPAGMTIDRNLKLLYGRLKTPYEWHEEIFDKCKELELICFSAPFSPEDVDFLETLGCPMYKVASFEAVDIPLITHIAKTGKPILISTGMATETEITEALRAAQGCDVTLLKCTSAYPADPAQANLLTIGDMKKKYKHVRVGISDHAPGIGVSVAAVALGATVIEKHFTIEKKGVDAEVSLNPEEFLQLVRECVAARLAIGHVHYGPVKGELTDQRRSIWIVKTIHRDDKFTPENIKCLRPAGGLEPKHYANLIGKRTAKELKKGQPLTWDCL